MLLVLLWVLVDLVVVISLCKDLSLEVLVDTGPDKMNEEERMLYFIEQFPGDDFSRKDYMKIFSKISGATASRDLQNGVENGLLFRTGEKRLTRYKVKK